MNKIVLAHIELVDDEFQNPKATAPRNKVNLPRELEISQKRRRNWLMALGDGKLSGHDYAALIDQEDKRIQVIKEKAEPEPEQTIPLSEIRKTFDDLNSNWQLIDTSTQKQIVQSLFKNITIKKSDVWHIVDMLTV